MKILVTPAALQDLKDIKSYIADDLSNPSAAVNTVKRIISAYKKLSDTPLMGTLLQQSIHLDIPFRFLVSGSYLIFYKVTDNIEIHRIIYGRRDYIRILFNDFLESDIDNEIE